MIDKILNTPLKYMYKYNLTISTYDEQNLWDIIILGFLKEKPPHRVNVPLLMYRATFT